MVAMAEQYDRIQHLLTGTETPDEALAFMLGYLDGESNIKPTNKGAWYKQGHKHGIMGDARDDNVKTNNTTDADRHGSDDDWCRI